ncbi:phytoene desaturase family protein [Flexibacterium corallicola]|uniref:phytoene desaturase family protein n=1 Tax=Flexibacterium corallicola TaxID=3037259 RepID=UPI00286EE12D|nr:NAD(P)/FAD-dependent oxidoreductase [Pseudovibrio sp. M1P-2-3]
MKDFDAIVIGAGNGGLTAAATLQQKGLRTLLIERHNIPGGCATSFVRGDYEFEVALHQLSGMGTEKHPFILRQLFTKLGIMNKLEFVEEASLYRSIVPGKLDITLPASNRGISKVLKENFPEDAGAVDGYLELCKNLTIEAYMLLPNIRKTGDTKALEKNCGNYVKYGLRPASKVLDEFFKNEKLKFLLANYWGYVGMPPNKIAFVDLATMFFAYATYKPYHVKGGSQALSNALLEVFLEAGGQVRFNCAAEKIIATNGAVQAVGTEHGEEYSCHHVISNASSIITYNELLESDRPIPQVKTDFKSRSLGVSGFVIYLGLDCTPQELGVTEASTFISKDLNHEEAYRRASSLEDPTGCLLTCYNLENPSAAPKGKSHVALMCIQYGSQWEKVPEADYAKTKYALADKLLDLAETAVPGIREHIEEAEVATPLTMMRYLNTPGGAIYGFDQDASDATLFRDNSKEISGLHLAGAWSGMGGFQPTYQAGITTASAIAKKHKALTEKVTAHA